MAESHVNHAALLGYDERNVYHDGCPVCEARAGSGLDVFGALDEDNLAILLGRADEIDATGAYPEWSSDCDRRVCELVLRLAALRRQADRARARPPLRSIDGTLIE